MGSSLTGFIAMKPSRVPIDRAFSPDQNPVVRLRSLNLPLAEDNDFLSKNARKGDEEDESPCSFSIKKDALEIKFYAFLEGVPPLLDSNESKKKG